MLLKALNKFIIESKLVSWIRSHIILLGSTCFLALNFGNSLGAVKISMVLLIYKTMSPGRQSEVNEKLFSIESYETLGSTLSAALLTIVIVTLLVWYIDSFGLRHSLMNRELRHLRKSVRREIRDLESQNRLIMSLRHEQALTEQKVKIVNEMEDIIERYEHNARALNPQLIKRAKLSEKDKTLQDLFDEDSLSDLHPKKQNGRQHPIFKRAPFKREN